MSRRTSITKALAEKINETLDGTHPYEIDLKENCYPKLKFWDEVNDFPSVYISTGTETREYLPSDFTWSFLALSVKLYCKGEDPQEELEKLIEEVEMCIDSNRVLVYDKNKGYTTTEILITSVSTDEGLLHPYGVGEINLEVRYQIM